MPESGRIRIVRLEISEDQRIKTAPIEKQEQSRDEYDREGEHFIYELRLVVKMHEYQTDKTSFDGGEDHTDHDILAVSGEFDRRKPHGEDRTNGENTTNPEDLADGLFDFFGAISHDACRLKVTSGFTGGIAAGRGRSRRGPRSARRGRLLPRGWQDVQDLHGAFCH
jgi:hypothetical protein